ncbi:MAG TPA: folylpolyglutamate synthase/dihydrofolate synthase family protein, partial [Candidatus Eisenbacteria bacterium]|nr:folylpolyglutamate synthase/dihydrofolate synthase family protein [Candidatus Eisenbacteria bacterium]
LGRFGPRASGGRDSRRSDPNRRMTAIAGPPLARRLEQLYRFERSGMRPGLEGIKRLLDAAGRPERAFPSALIAGTNGKGSTAAHLASILQAAGWRVGLYTSPHLVRFQERIRIDGAEIGDDALDALLARWWPRFEDAPTSFFEAATALAFDHFAESRVDFAVVEVGLGGRLDATNILTPRVSVITTIASDHAEILGGTLRLIALEKAGIVKEGGTLVLGVRAPEPRAAILQTAAARGARVLRLGADARYAARSVDAQGTTFRLTTRSYRGTLRTPLIGVHQARNAALAALAAEAILEPEGRRADSIADAIASGVAATRWPGRAELLAGDPPILLDVAHNVEGAQAIAATAGSLFGKRPLVAVAAFSRDKQHAAILRALGRAASRFILTQFAGERATPAAELLSRVPGRTTDAEAVPDPVEALARARRWASEHGGAVLVTGSFFLIGELNKQVRQGTPHA